METRSSSISMCERDGCGREIGRGRSLLAALRAEPGVVPDRRGTLVLGALSREGTVVDPLPQATQAIPALASLYRPSVQPYLISWFKYVPSAQIATLTVPVLILQGTTDIQVSVDEAKALKAAKPDAELVLIEGMNHVMKRAPADRAQNAATYSNPDIPIVPDVPKAIVELARRVMSSWSGIRLRSGAPEWLRGAPRTRRDFTTSRLRLTVD